MAAAPPAADAVDVTQWLIRSRSDQCEMLLRQEKFKEALELVKATLAIQGIEESRFQKLALYHLGYAQFACGTIRRPAGP